MLGIFYIRNFKMSRTPITPKAEKVLTSIERAIINVSAQLKRKRVKIDELSNRADLNEKQKITIGEELQFYQGIESLIRYYREDVDRNLGRILPHATDMEEAVLGAIIMFADAFPKVSAFLVVDHFYEIKHQHVYRAILGLEEKKTPIDMRTVVAELRRLGLIELIGDAYFIAELTSKVISPTNIVPHTKIIIEHAIKREIARLGTMATTGGFSDTVDCFELLDDVNAQLNKVRGWIK